MLLSAVIISSMMHLFKVNCFNEAMNTFQTDKVMKCYERRKCPVRDVLSATDSGHQLCKISFKYMLLFVSTFVHISF